MINYHIHTKRCGHAYGEIEEYVAEAKKVGLKEIGFSDHIPMYFLPVEERDKTIAMAEEELPTYVEEVLSLRRNNPELKIKLGIEADFEPGSEEQLRQILCKFPLDYVFGSIHFLDGWGYDNPAYIEEYNQRKIDDIYETYFKKLKDAASSGLFDILAHPDLIKKMGFKPEKSMLPLYEQTVKVISEKAVCIEVNTAGLRAPVKELYPNKEFLELCFHYGVPVTIGTDAHHPSQVGEGLQEGFQLIKEVGYKQIATFEKRKRIMVDIE